MADINGAKISATNAQPNVHYVITYTKSRPSNSQMTYTFTIKTNLNSSSSFLGTGHNLQCTMTVNGTSKSVELKNRSESWSGNAVKSTKTLTITCSSTTGNATQSVTFKVDNPYGAAGEVTNKSYTVTSSALTYTKCGAPTTFTVNKSQAAPASRVTLSWKGASAGTANAIQRYRIEYTTNGGPPWAATNPYNYNTSATSGSLTITLPSVEGATFGFRIRTEGAAGSNYYSDYKYIYNVLTTYSRPTMSVCSASQSLGTYTITWSAGSAGKNNPISKYEIWYSYKTSSSGSWSTRIRIASVSSSTRSYKWSGGTVGYYYRFSVVAFGTNYSYSATTNTWSTGYKKDYSHTACGAPSNLKSNITNPTIGQTITLSWTAGSAGTNNSVTGYELYYSTNGGSTYNLISSSIEASPTSYDYTVPRTPGEIKFRVRTRGSAGSSYYSSYSYSSNYQTITIQQADPPTAGTVNATLIDYGSTGGKAFDINWADFLGGSPIVENGITKYLNPISGYSLYYQTSKTIDDSDFGSLTLISSNLNSSTTSDTFFGGIWNNYYKFAVKAKGQYYGESPLVYSTAVQRVTDASTPPTAFEYMGSAYTNVKGTNYVIPGLKIAVMPIGASNAVSYTVQYREVKNGTPTLWRTIAQSLSLNKYTVSIKISDDLKEGDYINFRALSRNTAGDGSDYFPADTELGNYKIEVKTFENENNLHPRVQIKRAHTDTWAREDNLTSGIRVFDGEFAYDTEKRILKIGNTVDGSPQKFGQLQNTFGLIEVGTDNKVTSINSAAIGNNNICTEFKGYAVLSASDTTMTLSSTEGLSPNMDITYSYRDSRYSAQIVSIPTPGTITLSTTVYYYDSGSHTFSNGALWVPSDMSKGDITIDAPTGLLVGTNNNIGSAKNTLIIGDNNTIASGASTSSILPTGTILAGHSNKITTLGMDSIYSGSRHEISENNFSLVSGRFHTITGGSHIFVSGFGNTASGSYNLIGEYLTGAGEEFGLTVGKYNLTVSDSLFVVGNGTSRDSRSNAFCITTSSIYNNLVVYNNEKTWFQAETVFNETNNFLNNTITHFYINTSSSTSGTKLTVNYSDSIYYFYPTPTGTVRLGSPAYKWHSIYATNGTIQTSGRNDKYNIHYLENLSPKLKTLSAIQEEEKITFNDVLSFINNIKPATFIYKDNTFSELKNINDLVGTEGMSSIQLGLIADDIANDKLYKYIGVKTETTKTTNSNNEQENPAGNSSLDEEPIYGLQPLPVATLALTGCKILLQKIDQLEQEIADLKSSSL